MLPAAVLAGLAGAGPAALLVGLLIMQVGSIVVAIVGAAGAGRAAKRSAPTANGWAEEVRGDVRTIRDGVACLEGAFAHHTHPNGGPPGG